MLDDAVSNTMFVKCPTTLGGDPTDVSKNTPHFNSNDREEKCVYTK